MTSPTRISYEIAPTSGVAIVLEYLADVIRGNTGPKLPLRESLAALQTLVEPQLQWLLNETGLSSIRQLEERINMSYVRTYEEPFMQYPEYRMKKYLLLYIPPILIFMGSLGNIFSFIVLRTKSMKKVSSYLYLAVLAIADTFVLYIGLLRVWIGELTGFELQPTADWVCKLVALLGYVTSDFSVCLIVAVTVERYIVVCFPFRASSMCNVSRAKKIIALIFVTMLVLNLHFLWTVEVVWVSGERKCEGIPPFTYLVAKVWPWVDAFVYSFIPFVTITILNFLIIKEVLGARSNRLLMSRPDRQLPSEPGTPGENRRTNSSSEGPKLTIMLVTVSFTFLVLTLPNNIALIISNSYNTDNFSNQTKAATQAKVEHMVSSALLFTITELLMYVNHSINFFLYCATGNKFRHQTLQLLSCCFRVRRRRGRGDQRDLSDMHSMYRTSQSVLGPNYELAVHDRSRRGSSVSRDFHVKVGFVACDSSSAPTEGSGKLTVWNGTGRSTTSSSSCMSEQCMSPNGLRMNGSTKGLLLLNGNSADRNKDTSTCSPVRCNSHKSSGMSNKQRTVTFLTGDSHHKSKQSKKKKKDKDTGENTHMRYRLLFSSKKNESVYEDNNSNSRSYFDKLTDKEYILLEPTIQWRDVSS